MGYHDTVDNMDSLEDYWNMVVALLALARDFFVFRFMQLDSIYFELFQSRFTFALIAIELPSRERALQQI
jgi:hypothetical protein